MGCPIEFTRPIVVRLHARAPFSEAAMRNSTISVILAVIFGFSVGSSMASETTMRKSSAEELKSVCDKAGGSFSQDAGGYGCGTNCQGKAGTDCVQECRERLLRAGSGACAPNKPFECTRPTAARIERYGSNGALSCGSYPWALGCRIGWASKIRRCRLWSPCIAQW